MTMDKLIYLDYAAATPLDKDVLAAMQPYFADAFYNPSATYQPAQKVHKALEEARGTVAHWLGAKSSEIIFTAGGTEANNLAIHGVMRQFSDANIVVSGIEHESVLAPAHQYDYREVAVQPDGRVNLEDLMSKIDDKTVLVSIMYANNEIGTVQPIRDVAAKLAEIRKQRGANGLPLYLHTDACQAGNYLALHVARLGVDLMTLNGGKLYGPKQSGVLYVKAGLVVQPLIVGGGQERNLRSGTENVPAAIGFAHALDRAQNNRHAEGERLQVLQKQFFAKLAEQLPAVSINGSLKYRLPNNIHITLPGFDNERLLLQLEQQGILAASGSACSASSEEPSHVLAACGLGDEDIQSSLRFSMGRQTSQHDLDAVFEQLKALAS